MAAAACRLCSCAMARWVAALSALLDMQAEQTPQGVWPDPRARFPGLGHSRTALFAAARELRAASHLKSRPWRAL